MGELIKKIGTIHIAESEFDIEINEANFSGGEKIIHIQNEKVRYAFSQTDFVKALTTILSAEDYLHYYKGRDKLSD